MNHEIIVTKLDAAQRQLDTALLLFFRNKDVVSIHTLACAAEEILTIIAVKNGKRAMRQEILDMIKPTKRKEFKGFLNAAQNFFKHSDGNVATNLKFNTKLTEASLISACRAYQSITGSQTPYMQAFSVWFYLSYPEFLTDQQLVADAKKAAPHFNLGQRGQFLAYQLKLGSYLRD